MKPRLPSDDPHPCFVISPSIIMFNTNTVVFFGHLISTKSGDQMPMEGLQIMSYNDT